MPGSVGRTVYEWRGGWDEKHIIREANPSSRGRGRDVGQEEAVVDSLSRRNNNKGERK